jgi:hypothetical protein
MISDPRSVGHPHLTYANGLHPIVGSGSAILLVALAYFAVDKFWMPRHVAEALAFGGCGRAGDLGVGKKSALAD